MTVRLPLPAVVPEPTGPTVEPRDAATVVLLRDGAGGPEAYVLRRRASMRFAAGAYVFPGGGVDPRDSDASIGWVGPPPRVWAQRYACDESTAVALVCAAVRETFEESGVLLAGDAGSVVGDLDDDGWERDRARLEAGEVALAEVLASRGLMLRADLLGAWAHWITPAHEPRRYDTRFFVAALPAGQRVRDVGTEADRRAWVPLRDLVEGHDEGRYAMLPPTYVTCRDLAAYATAADALAAADGREIRPVLPRIVTEGDRSYLEMDLP